MHFTFFFNNRSLCAGGQKNNYTFCYRRLICIAPNGWFEIGCELIDATPINRAVGGEAIADTPIEWLKETYTVGKNWKVLMP